MGERLHQELEPTKEENGYYYYCTLVLVAIYLRQCFSSYVVSNDLVVSDHINRLVYVHIRVRNNCTKQQSKSYEAKPSKILTAACTIISQIGRECV